MQFETIEYNRTVTLRAEIGEDTFRATKENQGLIDEMGAEIEEHAGTRKGLLSPGTRFERRTEAIEAAFIFSKPSQTIFIKELANGEEIAIPAAILKNAEQAANFAGEANQCVRVGGGDGERLVDHHVLASLQSLCGEVEVGGVGRSDHHEIDAGIGEEGINVAHNSGLRIILF